MALVVSLLPIEAWAASPGDRSGLQLPGLQEDLRAKLDQVAAAKLEGWAGVPAQPPVEYEPSKVTPPSGGSAEVALTTATGDQLVPVGSLPVAIGKATPTEENPAPPAPTGTWSVAVEARTATEAAGVDGALITVTAPAESAAPVDVQLDYQKFEDLYGTEWSSRLELKQLPECFLTTPELPECSVAQEVPSTNDPATGTVRATVDPQATPAAGMTTMAGGGGTTVLAATDSASGAGGTYKATPLSPSGSWSAGGSSGAMSWSYPLTLPAPPAGPAPKVTFTYSSQAVDGKTSVANSQASWIGDGWDYEPGYIERRYRSCDEDRKTTPNAPNNNGTADKKKSDLCWAGDNVVMSFGGATTDLVKDATTGAWVPANDDGSKVERKTDTTVANGAKDGEYWVLTTRDGTRYHFGRHDVDGAGTRTVTDSVFTVPVFGNHPGEPCYQSAYASSSCRQGWRWNLDYVEDVHGNAMVVDWKREENRYAKNEKFKEKDRAQVGYVRGGYPAQISYGLRAGNLSAAPSAKVEFSVAERCIEEGGVKCGDTQFESKNYGDKQAWWDTPTTLHCKWDAENCYNSSPTFWTRKRLTAVTTWAQRTPGSTELSKVDSWGLTQSFPKQRTDTHPPLWLESVRRTGYTTKDASGNQTGVPLPPVTFLANQKDMPNRVAKSSTDATPDFDRLRVETIRNETGGEVFVDYSDPCPVGTTHPKPEENTTRCFPVHWSPDSALEKPPLEWFNKYVVDAVVEKDRVARQPDVVTSYTYEGPAAWAKDSDEFSKPELRTYGQWRGYASVVVRKGATADTGRADATVQSQTRTRYFRGMSGDAGRAQIMVKDSTGTETLGEDLAQYAGLTAETITYTKAGGEIDSRVLSWPRSRKTASRPRDGTTALEAYRNDTARTDKIEAISGGRSRIVRTEDTFDGTYDLAVTSQTGVHTSDGSGGWTVTDQRCDTTTYVHNTAKHIIGLPQRERTTTGTCAQAATGTVVTDTRTSYDAPNAFGTAPVAGLAAQVDGTDAAGTGWITQSKIEYDSLGRKTKVTDAAGNATGYAYSPATGPAFSTTTTNALGHTSTTKVDPGRGSAVEVIDANARKSTSRYDAFGRVTDVWTSSQNPASDKPMHTFQYQIAEHQTPTVVTGELRDNGTYETSVTIYDGLLRPRQVQKEAAGGGRIVTDTFYNQNGTIRQTNNDYYAEGEPGTKIFVPETVFHVPNSAKTSYDGLDRPLQVTTLFADEPKHSTVQVYDGESTLTRTGMSADGTTPLKGSRATKKWTDALDRTTLIRNYTATDLTTWGDNTYTYDPRGNLARVTDPAGNVWTNTYDSRGRPTASTDPDTGSAAFGYDDLDRRVWVQDSAGRKTFTTYDKLGRKTSEVEDEPNGTLSASWTYDTLPGAKGHPVAATRHTGGTAVTTEVTGYDAEYRPTGRKITVPDTAATKGLAGTYTYGTSYTRTGNVQSSTVPATPGGLAAERLVNRFDADDRQITMSGLAWYTAGTVYNPFGEVLRTASGSAPNRVWTTNLYDPNTGRVTDTFSDRETAPNRIAQLSYGYDTVGNVTSITENRPGGWTDRQCFQFDAMGQLTEAWTGKTDQCAGPTLNDVTAGPDGDGYWQSYRFDKIGNRTKLVQHDLTNSALDDETTYSYGIPIPGGPQPPIKTQPHALATAETTVRTANSTTTTQSSYTYDSLGNTTKRTIGNDTQTLTWDRHNKLSSATSAGVGSVAITGLAGKCLDVESGRSADGTAVQLWGCNESKAQQWRLTGGTVRALGKCLSNESGALRIATCDGNPKQKFEYRAADKTLRHTATDSCVDVPGGNSADGTDLILYACAGGPNQQWGYTDGSSYLYDAEGNRLISENGSSRTLHLGEAEVTVDKAGQALSAVRYYASPGAPVTVRFVRGSSNTLSVLLSDHHNTATTMVAAATGQALTRRKFDPYGNQRGAFGDNWRGNRTFLGTGTEDSATGLTHIGAREYEPATGRFITVDPLIDDSDPLQMNGYTYANANPVANWDPDGMALAECASGMYKCRNGTQPYDYGNRYETEVRAAGGTVSQDYLNRKAAENRACRHDPDCRSGRTYSSGSSYTPPAKKPEKKKGFWQSVASGDVRGAVQAKWDGAKDEWKKMQTWEYWRHKGVDKVITALAVAGTALCIASAVCGMGLFVVGASALFVAGLGAHIAVASEEERKKGGAQFLQRTAMSEVKGIALGATWGRGIGGALWKGGGSKVGLVEKLGWHPRTTGYFAGGNPIAHSAGRGASLIRDTKRIFTERWPRAMSIGRRLF
ncbi:ricin-type beta-trefoil lectin domain protein [Streptomyces sp. NPDC101132]|uniref:ricin-type beta-trefoil lectin domain protein n=1 Tax=Streptomyces sp. NPDC101132 TaxID=3366110 RepID=UPI003830A8F3